MILHQDHRENNPIQLQEHIGRVDTHWLTDVKIASSSPTATAFLWRGGGSPIFSLCMSLIFLGGFFVCFFF